MPYVAGVVVLVDAAVFVVRGHHSESFSSEKIVGVLVVFVRGNRRCCSHSLVVFRLV